MFPGAIIIEMVGSVIIFSPTHVNSHWKVRLVGKMNHSNSDLRHLFNIRENYGDFSSPKQPSLFL